MYNIESKYKDIWSYAKIYNHLIFYKLKSCIECFCLERMTFAPEPVA